MKVTLDGTPLLGAKTGIGRYTYELLSALPAALKETDPDSLVDTMFWSARGRTRPDLPLGVGIRGKRLPARVLRASWLRFNHPKIEYLAGACDVFHGTNFVSPPTRRAAEVVTVHDLTFLYHTATVRADALDYQRLIQRCLDRGAHVVTPTTAVARDVRAEYGLAVDRVHVTPLGVDHAWSLATPATSAWLGSRSLPSDYLLFVGSLDPRKNLVRLLEAHRRARGVDASVPDLVLAGPAGRTSVEIGSGVHVTGWLSDRDLQSLVAGARALVLPSLDEGFGLPVVEALSCGRPVVISNIDALTEVADPNATHCEPTDVDSIAQALAHVLDGPDGTTERQARKAWAGQFTWQRTAQLTVGAYNAALRARL